MVRVRVLIGRAAAAVVQHLTIGVQLERAIGVEGVAVTAARPTLKDNTQARYLRRSDMNDYRKTDDPAEHRAQFEIYDYFKDKL